MRPARADNAAILPFFNYTKSASLDWIGESIAERVRETLASEGLLVCSREDRQEVYHRLAIRPNAITLHREHPEGSARNVWAGEAGELNLVGDRARVRIRGTVPLVAEVTAAAVAALHLADGGPVWASVKATDVDTYPA